MSLLCTCVCNLIIRWKWKKISSRNNDRGWFCLLMKWTLFFNGENGKWNFNICPGQKRVYPNSGWCIWCWFHFVVWHFQLEYFPSFRRLFVSSDFQLYLVISICFSFISSFLHVCLSIFPLYIMQSTYSRCV